MAMRIQPNFGCSPSGYASRDFINLLHKIGVITESQRTIALSNNGKKWGHPVYIPGVYSNATVNAG